MKNRPTYDDIARLANVSKSTVSKVLNNKPGVSNETIKKVRDACAKLGYTPNFVAKGLRSNRTYSLGLIVPDITNSFFAEFAKAVESYAQGKNYMVLLADSFENPSREEELVKNLISRRVDGLIIITTSTTPSYMSHLPKHVVFADRPVAGARLSVYSDNYTGTFNGIKYLIRKGYRKILVISGPTRFRTYQLRLLGCKDAVLQSGIGDLKYREIEVEEVSVEVGESLAKEILEFEERFDAIFALSDILAIGILKTLSRYVEIPTDIAVLGFDGIKESEFINPELSTVKQDVYQMGLLATQMLISSIEEEHEERITRVLPVELIERAST